MSIVSRSEEVDILERLYRSNEPEFLALYGRRRVGKTFLVRSIFSEKDCIFFNVTGTKDGPIKDQIKHFTQRIGETFLNGITPTIKTNWSETFLQLKDAIDGVSSDKKVVIFIDELPWMATRKSKLLQTIDYYWNQYWSMDKRIKFIVCGSSASWIINKVINDKGGLHNRITREIHLKPFTLTQTKEFLRQQGVELNDKQVVQLYFVMGGVPFYLKKAEQGLSALQIVESLLSSGQSFLVNEFDKLFSSLFDNSESYIRVVKILAKSQSGIGERKLLEQLGKNFVGAKGKKILDDLEKTGFLMSFMPIYRKRQGRYYRLIDEYTIFYLKWIDPIKSELSKGALEPGYWQALQATPQWYGWQGYAFESVCHKHILNIKRALQLSPTAISGTWRYVPQQGSMQRGAQIDLLFDRIDDAITVCEIKYTKEPFVITKDYAEVLQQKMAIFKERTGTKKQLFTVIVSANGVKENQYSKSIVSGVVMLEDLFGNYVNPIGYGDS